MKRKNIVSLTIAFAIVCLGTTGLLLYFGLKPQAVTAIHVLFGLLFIGFVIFHIKNNWSSLKVYTKERKSSIIHKEFYVAAGIAIVVLTGAGFNLPPFGELVHAGEELVRGERREGRFNRTQFTDISTNKDVKGNALNLIIQKKQNIVNPVMAIWIEDSARQFVQNLFVPAKIMTIDSEEKDIRRAIQEGEISMEKLNPAVLPQWQSKTKDTASNYADPTPTDNFFLHTKSIAVKKYYVMVEIKNDNTTEVYESFVDTSRGNTFSIRSKNNALLDRAIIELID
jgi:Domain of unknown function (DUF4405)